MTDHRQDGHKSVQICGFCHFFDRSEEKKFMPVSW